MVTAFASLIALLFNLLTSRELIAGVKMWRAQACHAQILVWDVGKMRCMPLALALLVAITSAAFGQSSERLTFIGKGPDPSTERLLGTAWTIYVAGEIDVEAATRFETFLEANHVPKRSYVYLDSPGGAAVAGMEIGRVFRKHHLRTDIGKPAGNNQTLPAGCFSACALAYLGGEFRYLTKGSRYGVHRFSFSSKSAHDAELAQILSAAEVDYIRSMGVDPSLLTLSAATSAQDIFEPSEQQLLDLGVVNYGRTPAIWTIESAAVGLYLKGEQNTALGINKFIVGCDADRSLALYIVFDPQGREEEAVGFRADSLVINSDTFIPLNDMLLEKKNINGWVNAVYRLPDKYLAQIQSAKSVGVTMQASYQAPIFLGFNAMPFESGAAKLAGLLATCRGNNLKEEVAVSPTISATGAQLDNDSLLVNRVAKNFDRQYRKAGMTGIRSSIEACYAQARKAAKLTALEYCYLLDQVSSAVDAEFAEKSNAPQQGFWRPQSALARTMAIMKFVEIDGEKSGKTIQHWASLNALTLRELASIPSRASQ
jgi:hypothetical protein